MRKILAVFASQAAATQIKKHLFSEYGIKSELIPTPEKLSVSGCGFALRADYSGKEILSEVIEAARVSSKGIFDAETGNKI